jgi:uncharacterized protein YndB with AHSA1/START domain
MSEAHGKFEKVFELRVPVARVWQAFTDPRELEAWLSGTVEDCDVRPGGRIAWQPEAYGQLVWDVVEVEPERKLAYRESPTFAPSTTDVSVLLQESGSGTLVTITQAGFGEGEDWQTQLDNVGLGWAQSLAGLELYLRTGVRFDRFFTFKSDLGVLAHEEMAGPCVASVTPESYAAQAGLEVGDIIVQVGSAPIFTRSDLWLFTREHEIGEDIEVKFVRGSELRHGRAQLTAPWPG